MQQFLSQHEEKTCDDVLLGVVLQSVNTMRNDCRKNAARKYDESYSVFLTSKKLNIEGSKV